MLKDKLMDDMKAAMKSQDSVRVSVLRLLRGQIRQIEIDDKKELTDDDVIAVIARAAKQRRDSISSYENGGREDLAAAEASELEIILEYLPQPLTDDELSALVNDVIATTGAASMKDMGRVMGIVMGKVRGRAEGGRIQQMVKSKLS